MKAWVMRALPMADLTPSSTAVGYAVENVANDYMGVVWKSGTGATTQAIKIDMGSPVAVDAILLFGCTGAKAVWTLRVQSADDVDFTVNHVVHANGIPFLAGSEMPTHGRGVGYWEADGSITPRRYWRVQIGGLTSSEAVTIGRLAMGQRFRPGRNFGFGGGFGVRDLGKFDWSSSGNPLRHEAAALRTVGLTFPGVTKEEAEQKVQPLLERVRGQRPIVLVTDPEADALRQKRCWFGPLIGELGTVWAGPGRWEWRASLVDLVPIPPVDDPSSAAVVIVTPPPAQPTTVSISSPTSVTEGNSGGTTNVTATITRSGDLSGTSSVTVTVTGEGANPVNGADFVGGVLPSFTVSFPAGSSSQTATAQLVGDSTVEPSESMRWTLSNPLNCSISIGSTVTAVANDDGAAATTPLTIGLIGSSTPFRYTSEFTCPANARVFKSSDGTNFTAVGTTGQGLATLGNLLANALGRDIRFVPMAVSGTTAAQWAAANSTYRAAAVAAFNAANVDDVIWIGGFNDARNLLVTSSDSHAVTIRSVFSQLRSELGKPNLPIFLGTTQNYEEGNASAEQQEQWVRFAELTVAADGNNRLYAHSYDLPKLSDLIHMADGSYTTHATRGSKALIAYHSGTTYNSADAGPTPPNAAGPTAATGGNGVAQINFTAENTTDPTPAGWNDFKIPAVTSSTTDVTLQNGKSIALLDTAGAATGYTATILAAPTGCSFTNGTSSTTGAAPDVVLKSLWFNGDSNVGGPRQPTSTIRLSGLDSTKSYRLDFLGSRSGTTPRSTTYSAVGATTPASVTQDNMTRTSPVDSITLKPNASGVIDFTFVPAGTGTFGYLNFLTINRL